MSKKTQVLIRRFKRNDIISTRVDTCGYINLKGEHNLGYEIYVDKITTLYITDSDLKKARQAKGERVEI